MVGDRQRVTPAQRHARAYIHSTHCTAQAPCPPAPSHSAFPLRTQPLIPAVSPLSQPFFPSPAHSPRPRCWAVSGGGNDRLHRQARQLRPPRSPRRQPRRELPTPQLCPLARRDRSGPGRPTLMQGRPLARTGGDGCYSCSCSQVMQHPPTALPATGQLLWPLLGQLVGGRRAAVQSVNTP